MVMRQGSRPRSVPSLAMLALACLALAAGGFIAANAAEPTLSPAQLHKIDGWIADKGRVVAVSPIITDILGLTKSDQSISCRAFAALDAGVDHDIRQIYELPGGNGYLEDHFHQDRVTVYWANKDFVLIAAVSGVRGELPAPTSFTQAQIEFRDEIAWWANYADTH
jgi:hypothetical protein